MPYSLDSGFALAVVAVGWRAAAVERIWHTTKTGKARFWPWL